MTHSVERPTIGILTALPKECAAILAMLEDEETWTPPRRGSVDSVTYYRGRIPTVGGAHGVIVGLMPDMGNNAAAVSATRLMADCPTVRHIIMCGIAGGVPRPGEVEHDVRLGDIVVSDRNGVVQYDLIKERPDGSKEHRQPPRPPGATLLGAVKRLSTDEVRGRRPWEALLLRGAGNEAATRPADDVDARGNPRHCPADPKRRAGVPRVFHGTVAAANTLLKNPTHRDHLGLTFGVKAVEMEGSGIADAAWAHEVGYLVVRGICDDCDGQKGDVWQGAAAVAAAAYTRAVVAAMPLHDPTDEEEAARAAGKASAPPHDAPGVGTQTFVGRERELVEVVSLLQDGNVQLNAALDGLPGIGKTELARQVIARLTTANSFPGGIYWFAAEQRDLRLQWGTIGDATIVDLDERARSGIERVRARAGAGHRVLLVLDNVETWSPPPAPLPPTPGITLLVTTQHRRLHNSFKSYEVQPLTPAAARQLLEAIAGSMVADADDLIEALAGHVLSIELAGTYLHEYGGGAAPYLANLRAGLDPGQKVAPATAYRATAQQAFRLLWERLDADVREAWYLAAMFSPGWFTVALADAVGLNAEKRRSLFIRHALDRDESQRFQMHRLLREFALQERPATELATNRVLADAARYLFDGDRAFRFRRFSANAASYEHWLRVGRDGPAAGALFDACASALQQLGDFSRARDLYEQALKAYGDDHPDLATGRSNLAGVLRQLGDLSAARSLYEQALTSDLKTYDDHHPQVASGRDHLAGVLQELGDLANARDLYERALASNLQTYGDDHPTVATSRANLAGLFLQLGDLANARDLYERALASNLKTFGDDHPTVATVRSNLALLLLRIGDLTGARSLYEQALTSDLKTFGDDHPTVATVRSNLALLLLRIGDLAPARNLFERALATYLKTYSDDHPTVATVRCNLATLLQQVGDLTPARDLFEQSLAADLKTYGEAHPIVAIRRSNLAGLLKQIGDLTPARELLEEALAADLKTYGKAHPTVAIRRSNLAGLLLDVGDLTRARDLYERALASNLKTYGEDHPTVATDHANMAGVLWRLGDLANARVFYEWALAGCLKFYGEDHLEVAAVRSNLAGVVWQLGNPTRACDLYERALAGCLKFYGEHHPEVAALRSKLAEALRELADIADGEVLDEENLFKVLQLSDVQ